MQKNITSIILAALVFFSAQVNAISVQEKKALIPDYLVPLAKELKCKDMKACNDIFSKMIKKELLKFLDLVDKKVNMKKAPKSFKDSIDKLKTVVEKAKKEAKAKAEKIAKEKAAKSATANTQTKNPCPVIREVQFEPIPALPQPTKLCFGANGTSTIEGVSVKMVLAPKKSLQLPQYFFKTSISCSKGQVTAIKADASGLECVAPGASKYQFTYNYCPSGFELIPRPENDEKPKFCFGHLPIINSYVIWIYNAPSSTYAGLPESEFGINRKCSYSEGWVRAIDKKATAIECQYKKDALYSLPDRYSVIFPLPTLDGSTTSTPHLDQGSAAGECFKGVYGKPFQKAKTQICRLFKSGS